MLLSWVLMSCYQVSSGHLLPFSCRGVKIGFPNKKADLQRCSLASSVKVVITKLRNHKHSFFLLFIAFTRRARQNVMGTTCLFSVKLIC